MDLKISIDDEVYNHFLNNEYSRLDIIAVHNALYDAKPDIIRCKDCKHFEKWRTPERSEQFGYLGVCGKYVISTPSPDDYCSKAERKEFEEDE